VIRPPQSSPNVKLLKTIWLGGGLKMVTMSRSMENLEMSYEMERFFIL